MKKTVGEIKQISRALLGEAPVGGSVFDDTTLQPFFGLAFEEMHGEMIRNQLPGVEVVDTATISASVVELDPFVTESWSVGEIKEVEERLDGSNEKYTPVRPVDKLSQRESANRLQVYEWRGEKMHFVAATTDRQIRVTFLSSGAAPTLGSTVINIDDAQSFLAYRTAALAGRSKGHEDRTLDIEARGSDPDRRPGGALHRLLQPMVRSLQKDPIRRTRYIAGAGHWSRGGLPPTRV